MRKRFALGLCIGTLVSCDNAKELSEDVCGPCGDVEQGDVGISGVAQIDGFFAALAQLDQASASLRGDFEAHVAAIGDAFGVARGELSFDDYVAAIKLEIETQITANVSGSLRVNYVPPKCSANVEVAVEAQASCEVKAGCDVEATPPSVSVSCEGQCRGGCSGSCTGEVACEASLEAACSGTCEGTCDLTVAGNCSGKCTGACSGTCSLVDNQGTCQGTCTGGTCQGSCELEAGGSCSGTCHGKCVVDASVGCTGEVECRGSCDAECSGHCEGEATPPSIAADCDASADCQATAKAQASASLECTPPKFEVDFDFDGTVTAEGRAEFLAKFNVLKVEMIGILQGLAHLDVLLNGSVKGDVTVPPVTTQLEAAFSAVVDGGVDSFDIPSGRIACVIPAFEAAIDTLAEVPTEMAGTIQGQIEFAAVFGLGAPSGG
jgi:hypothetical protein